SPDGKALFGSGSIWDLGGAEPGRRRPFPVPPQPLVVYQVLSDDGQTLVSGGRDAKVRVWDMRGEEPREWLVLGGEIRRRVADVADPFAQPVDTPPMVALSPNGVHLAFSEPKGSVHLWVLAGLEPRERAKLEGTGWPISSLAFSPDGKILAAGSN